MTTSTSEPFPQDTAGTANASKYSALLKMKEAWVTVGGWAYGIGFVLCLIYCVISFFALLHGAIPEVIMALCIAAAFWAAGYVCDLFARTIFELIELALDIEGRIDGKTQNE